MSVTEENICARLDQEPSQVSPFLQGVRFADPSCTPSQQIDLLDVKDDYFKPSHVNHKVDISGENFLQYWGKQVENYSQKDQELPLEGPVGHILKEFEHEHRIDDSFNSHNSFGGKDAFYSPNTGSLEEFFDEAPKNFEEIIDECSDGNCHFNQCIEEDNTEKADPTLAQKDKGSAEESHCNISSQARKKRDVKMSRKAREANINFTKDSGRKSILKKHQRISLKTTNREDPSLIIKIRSGNKVLTNEKV